ncbi:hypothetical protein MJG53_002899 [Ovis ammon polii x Ovis aries]|uniref:Uncharacterized protein n=1 Tax=Ovis ammon polii x Ovis aries TaxID=2918886 RepID=A0ACB9VFH9_9CETA|nr:hypothetical protein MJT46_004239 [Ovis ammon polii x Ovis aries]KAI4588491.1 hypothetical protein MJG53_002899 [Ovis ammon polii x Ovis aries]
MMNITTSVKVGSKASLLSPDSHLVLTYWLHSTLEYERSGNVNQKEDVILAENTLIRMITYGAYFELEETWYLFIDDYEPEVMRENSSGSKEFWRHAIAMSGPISSHQKLQNFSPGPKIAKIAMRAFFRLVKEEHEQPQYTNPAFNGGGHNTPELQFCSKTKEFPGKLRQVSHFGNAPPSPDTPRVGNLDVETAP